MPKFITLPYVQANQLLPAECSHHSHYLPSLMAMAASFDIPNQQRLYVHCLKPRSGGFLASHSRKPNINTMTGCIGVTI